MNSKKPFHTLSSKIAWSCPWYKIRQDEIVTPNGQHGQYNIVETEPAVWIVPVTANKEFVLINHYRYTVDDWVLEVPAGSIKKGQTPEEAAREELREEIGGINAELKYIGQFYTADGICNEIGHIFFAAQVELITPDREPAEIIEIQIKPIEEVLDMARANQISDGPSALAIFLCSAQLEKIKASL